MQRSGGSTAPDATSSHNRPPETPRVSPGKYGTIQMLYKQRPQVAARTGPTWGGRGGIQASTPIKGRPHLACRTWATTVRIRRYRSKHNWTSAHVALTRAELAAATWASTPKLAKSCLILANSLCEVAADEVSHTRRSRA